MDKKKQCPVDPGKVLIGLECCRQPTTQPCLGTCPYSNVSGSCISAHNSEALAYINYLEEQLAAKADAAGI